MKKALVLLAALALAAGPALAKNDKGGANKSVKPAGEARTDKVGKGGGDAAGQGMSFDHRRDGRGATANPGGGKATGRSKTGKSSQ